MLAAKGALTHADTQGGRAMEQGRAEQGHPAHRALGSPRLFHDASRSAIRPVERQVLRILDVADFMSLAPASASTAAAGRGDH